VKTIKTKWSKVFWVASPILSHVFSTLEGIVSYLRFT